MFDAGEHEWCWRDYLVNNPVSAQFGAVLDKLVIFGTKKRYSGAGEVLQDLGATQQSPAPSNQPKITVPPTHRMQVPSSKPQILTESLPRGIKLEMIKIPAGSFLMGSNEKGEESPIHQVNVQEFYLGKYPVTQEQWPAVMGNNPSYFSGNSQNPVERVSWNDCQTFCQKLSQITGKYYRLPNEAEWEYACRSGTQTRYYFGDSETKIGDYAWYSHNSGNQTHPVGQKKQNPWGLYDMHGNIWEWCEDQWHNNYQGAPKDGSPWIDNFFRSRIVRGGSCNVILRNCRSAYRSSVNPDYPFNGLGFRVALVL